MGVSSWVYSRAGLSTCVFVCVCVCLCTTEIFCLTLDLQHIRRPTYLQWLSCWTNQ